MLSCVSSSVQPVFCLICCLLLCLVFCLVSCVLSCLVCYLVLPCLLSCLLSCLVLSCFVLSVILSCLVCCLVSCRLSRFWFILYWFCFFCLSADDLLLEAELKNLCAKKAKEIEGVWPCLVLCLLFSYVLSCLMSSLVLWLNCFVILLSCDCLVLSFSHVLFCLISCLVLCLVLLFSFILCCVVLCCVVLCFCVALWCDVFTLISPPLTFILGRFVDTTPTIKQEDHIRAVIKVYVFEGFFA